MEIIKNVISYIPIGVIIGFIVNRFITDFLNKPKLKYELRSLYIKRCKLDSWGQEISVMIPEADTLRIQTDIVIANTGANNTAITDLDIRLYSRTEEFSIPVEFEVSMNNSIIPNAFNIPANSCVVLKIKGFISRQEQEYYENYFVDEMDLELHVFFKNVKGRNKKLIKNLDGTFTTLNLPVEELDVVTQ